MGDDGWHTGVMQEQNMTPGQMPEGLLGQLQ